MTGEINCLNEKRKWISSKSGSEFPLTQGNKLPTKSYNIIF